MQIPVCNTVSFKEVFFSSRTHEWKYTFNLDTIVILKYAGSSDNISGQNKKQEDDWRLVGDVAEHSRFRQLPKSGAENVSLSVKAPRIHTRKTPIAMKTIFTMSSLLFRRRFLLRHFRKFISAVMWREESTEKKIDWS